MQLGVDVTCIHTSFGGHGFSGFGDMTTFQKRPNFPFRAWTMAKLWWAWFFQFWWAWFLRFRIYGYPLKTAKFPFWGMDYGHGKIQSIGISSKFNRSE